MSKLVLRELGGSVFRWIWRLAGFSVVVAVGLALLGGSWWGVFWALLMATVARWLTTEFSDRKIRVHYENRLIDVWGYSPDDATRAWAEAYQEGGRDALAELESLIQKLSSR